MSANKALTVLVLAAGGSVGHGILKSLALCRLPLRVLGADVAPDKAGLFTVDGAFVSPWANDPSFLDWLIGVCQNETVDAIIPAAEPVIKTIAKHRERVLSETGAVSIVTSLDTFLIGDDKLQSCRWLEQNGFACPGYAPSEDPQAVRALAQRVGYPLIAKKRVGGGSLGLVRIQDERDLEYAIARPGFLFQQYVGNEDSEYTVGCFCDRNGDLRGTVVFRRRLQLGTSVFIEAGEFPEVRAEAESIVRALRPIGPCNIQLRVHNGRPYCIELQVRFSGTTPMRTRLGFTEVEAALRHFVLGENEISLPKVVEGCALRYWNELYIDPRAYESLRLRGELRDGYPVIVEDYGAER